MKNKNSLPFYKILSAFLLTWALATTSYILWTQFTDENINSPQQLKLSLKNTDIHQGFVFLRQFLKNYYTLNPLEENDQKLKQLKPHLSPYLQKELLPEYEEALKHFLSQEGSQKAQLQKSIWNAKDRSYLFFLKVEQKSKSRRKNQYLIKLRVTLNKKNNHWSISSWQERVLPTPPQSLTDKVTYLNLESPTLAHFPCKIKEISTKNTKIPLEIKKSASSQEVSLLPKENLSSMDSLKVSCAKFNFTLNLNTQKEKLTLYQDFGLKDGIRKKRKLSPEQKLKKDIEEQLGITIVD